MKKIYFNNGIYKIIRETEWERDRESLRTKKDYETKQQQTNECKTKMNVIVTIAKKKINKLNKWRRSFFFSFFI